MWTTVNPGSSVGPGRGGRPVQRGRAQAAAEDEHDPAVAGKVELAPALLRRRVEHRPGYRPARELVAGRAEVADREREEHPARERRGHPVGEAEVRVHLHQRRRDAHAGCRGQHRPGHVAAPAEHDVGPDAAEDARARGRGEGGQAEPAHQAERRPPREPGHVIGVERIAGGGDEPGLDPLGRAGEHDVGASSRELCGDRQRRHDVACGSSGCDQHPRAAAGVACGWRRCHRRALPCGRLPARCRRRSGASRSG